LMIALATDGFSAMNTFIVIFMDQRRERRMALRR
jgi:hypothetical protein